MPEVRIPAELYDKLKAKADEVGGVGARRWFRDGKPCCLEGIALAIDGADEDSSCYAMDPRLLPEARAAVPTYWQLSDLGVGWETNDRAWASLSCGGERLERFPFDLMAQEMGLVREAT